MKFAQDGYVALMSAIIISLLLLAVTLTVGFSGIFGRLNVLDSESKERSLALAEACVDTVILNISQNQTPPATVTVGTGSCKIISVQSGVPVAGQTTIKTQACINKAVTNLNVVIDETYVVTSFEEVPNFSPNAPCP